MAYLLITVIVACQVALALGNYLLRPKPRPTAATVLLILGFILAGGVVTQFAVTKVRELDVYQQLAAAKARKVTDEQHTKIVELLSPNQIFKGPVLINTLLDGEASQFGKSISNALKDAGFSPAPVPFGARLLGLSVPGAFIWIRDFKNQPRHAGPIFEAFRRVEIALAAEERPDAVQDTETVIIVVGSHP
jgi:hypothetical protein